MWYPSRPRRKHPGRAPGPAGSETASAGARTGPCHTLRTMSDDPHPALLDDERHAQANALLGT
ncbi:hypothetical protein, partial [Nocardia nova]|uniref:hypothetical protein n=1 Tax=Nocardia nova TaxID=37330 RepID=UPI0025B034F4